MSTVTTYLAGQFTTIETNDVSKTCRKAVAEGSTILSIFRN